MRFMVIKMSGVAHVMMEENTLPNMLSKLASTGGSGVNHSFIQENPKNPSIQTPKDVVMVIGGTGHPYGYLSLHHT